MVLNIKYHALRILRLANELLTSRFPGKLLEKFFGKIYFINDKKVAFKQEVLCELINKFFYLCLSCICKTLVRADLYKATFF